VSTGGRYGHGKTANDLLAGADVVLLLGSRTAQLCYNNWTTPNRGATVIHVDIDPREFGRNFPTALPLAGDVRATLRDLITDIRRLAPSQVANSIAFELESRRNSWRNEIAPVAASSQIPMRPERALDEIDKTLGPSSLVVTDASYSTGWAMNQMHARRAGRFILSPRGTAGIGWGLPAAIGAKLADPTRDVVCITGDGGFGYVINELETAARHRADLLVIVFNNSTLGFQRHWEEKMLGRYLECDFLDVDYSEVARSLKGAGERVTDPAKLGDAIARGRAYAGPYVIDAVIDPEATAPIAGFDRPIAAGTSH
jgi:acetolactate synthase-1/2/3 large subunit